METKYIWSWLNILTKKRYDVLLQAYGSLDAALQHVDEDLLAKLGCKNETVYKVLNRLEEFDQDAYCLELQKRDLELISYEDDKYPKRLKEIGDPPMFLYANGDLEILSQPCIAIVGTRTMSSYGERVTELITRDITLAGMVTVSGLALGVDAEVAKTAIKHGGKTVAVLGHGLAMIYPKYNAVLAKEIVENGGLILSEYPLDVTPDKHTFPGRNRIVAGLSLGTVVTQAGEKSGALITADLALQYGRDVFAVPGQIFDEQYIGCHRIISSGQAKLVASAQDILQEYNISSASHQAFTFDPEPGDQTTIYSALTTMPQSVSDIVEKTNRETGQINAALTMMELAGGAKNVGNGMWVKM